MYSTICHFIRYNLYAFVIVQIVDATIYCACIVDTILLYSSSAVAILLNMQSMLIKAKQYIVIISSS